MPSTVRLSLIVVAAMLSLGACGTGDPCAEMGADCGLGVGGAKSDGVSTNLFDIRSEALKDKGYLNLADLEVMFHAVGWFMSPAESDFMSMLVSELKGRHVAYLHQPPMDEMVIPGIIRDGRIIVPPRSGSWIDEDLGAETVVRFVQISSPGGPRF